MKSFLMSRRCGVPWPSLFSKAKPTRGTFLLFFSPHRILFKSLDATNHAWESGTIDVMTNTNSTSAIGREPLGLNPASDSGLSSAIDDPARMLDGCRQYLLMIANEVVGPELQAKLGASDLVQDTFVEAQRHLAGFRGRTEAELRAWLRKILECRLSNLRRSYLATEKRASRREVAIETLLAGSGANGDVLASRTLSPSNHAVRSELTQALDRALARLPEHYRQAVAWRHQEQLSWDEIGRRMGYTA
jgi:RNA polymerase sigma-70 factor, ECF subfamily